MAAIWEILPDISGIVDIHCKIMGADISRLDNEANQIKAILKISIIVEMGLIFSIGPVIFTVNTKLLGLVQYVQQILEMSWEKLQ